METRRKRARYTKLRINEISAVDRPAQEGAVALLVIKRHDDDSFMDIVAKIQKRDGCSKLAAMATARTEHADAFERLQSGFAEPEPAEVSKASRRGLNLRRRPRSREDHERALRFAEGLDLELVAAMRANKPPAEVRQLAEQVAAAKRDADIW
jgi:hypothetical protein